MEGRVLVDAGNVIGTKEAAAALDIDIVSRMNQVGMDPELLNRQDGFISWHQFNSLLELIAREDQCHLIGLYVGKYQPAGNLGVIGNIMQLCPDVRTALFKGQQYLNVFTQASFWEVQVEGGFVSLTRISRSPQQETLGQSNTLGVAQTFKMLPALCGEDWQATSISFGHVVPNRHVQRQYEQFFHAPVAFGQESDSIFFPEHYLERRIPTADQDLLAVIEEHALSLRQQYELEGEITDIVRMRIRRILGSTRCNMEAIAQMLDIHPKQLHRKLKSHGVTFKQLLLEERIDLACSYLSKSDMPLYILADLLGYSTATALSRAFKNHCGVYPQQWKKQRAHPQDQGIAT